MTRRNNEIQILRAIAILLAILHDTAFLLPWETQTINQVLSRVAFWPGIDLFLCISGFVVSKSLVDFFDAHIRSRKIASVTARFWLRRLFRILPLAAFWLGLLTLAAAMFNTSKIFLQPATHENAALWALTFTGNFAQASPRHDMGPDYVYWTLALEAQFCLLLPIFLLTVRGKVRPILLGLLIALQFFLPRYYQNFLWFFRTDALLWGVMIYFFSRTALYQDFNPSFLKSTWQTALLVFVLVLLLMVAPVQLQDSRINIGVIALLCGALVFLTSYERNYLTPPTFIQPLLQWLASRAYALYLAHIPVYLLTYELWFRYSQGTGTEGIGSGLNTLRFTATALVLLPVCAELSYRLVERPFHRYGNRLAKITAR